MSWCKKRITNKELLVRFADGTHRFYLEAVCGEPVIEGNLCRYCCSLTPQTKTQDVKTFPHGLVTGKYPDDSHIYDSPWYHKKVEAYGPPSSEILELAMESQKKARGGIKVKNLKDVFSQIAATEHPSEKVAEKSNENTVEPEPAVISENTAEKTAEKKAVKRGRKPKTQTVNSDSPTIQEKNKRVTKPKKTENTTENNVDVIITPKALETIPQMTKFIENMNDVIVVDKVVKVYLKPFMVGSTKYYRDQEREKLYSLTTQQKVGKYVGRWDADQQKIIKDAPDSDEE
jgi:hypothetical protein